MATDEKLYFSPSGEVWPAAAKSKESGNACYCQPYTDGGHSGFELLPNRF